MYNMERYCTSQYLYWKPVWDDTPQASSPIRICNTIRTSTIYTEYYMSRFISHAVSPREPYITPRATSPRGDIGRRLIRHVVQIFTCNVHYIIYFNHAFDNTCILWTNFKFRNVFKLWKEILWNFAKFWNFEIFWVYDIGYTI